MQMKMRHFFFLLTCLHFIKIDYVIEQFTQTTPWLLLKEEKIIIYWTRLVFFLLNLQSDLIETLSIFFFYPCHYFLIVY